MLRLLILLFIMIIMGISVFWIAKSNNIPYLYIISAIAFIICGGIISEIDIYNRPTAIDVYRGETTLKVTYEDSIPVDTVVIFKNK